VKKLDRTLAGLLVVGLLALVLGFGSGQACAKEPVVVRVAPTTAEVGAGELVDVAVEAVDVEELYGADVVLVWDPTLAEVIDADPSLPGVQVALGLFLDPGFVIRNTADNEAGRVHFAMTQLNPSVPKSGTGNLIVVKFQGLVSGSSPLTLEHTQLAGPRGINIPSTGESGQLEVALSAGMGPTYTPIPTQGAGTPLPTPTITPTPGPMTDTPVPTTAPATATWTPGPPATETPASPTETPPAAPTVAASDTPLPPSATPLPQGTLPATTTLPPAASPVPATQTVAPATASPLTTAVSLEPSATAVAVVATTEGVVSEPEGEQMGRFDATTVIILVGSVCALGIAFVLGLVAVALWLSLRRSETE
jgi:hypothetical protein